MTEEPIWTDDALNRLLGACDGYIHAILDIRFMIGRFDSMYMGRFHPRYVRKIAERDAITKPLREIEAKLEVDLRCCQEAYRMQHDRAHPKTKAASSQHTRTTT